jgi:isopenicillin N synthase-like dioxygenase
MTRVPVTVPIIDIGGVLRGEDGALSRAAAELRDSLERIGFFYVSGHGVEWDVVTQAYEAVARFHALPVGVKERLAITGERPRGYLAQGRDITYNQTIDEGPRRASVNESFNIDLEERGLNQWPAEMPALRTAVLAYLAAVLGMSRSLLPIFARSLDLAPTYFDKAFEDPAVSLRLTHYPPLPVGQQGRWSLAPHTDGTFIAVLPANNVRGLWIKPAGSDWTEAPNVPGTFLVNSGDMMRRWTNDRFLATVHRVANNQDGERYAMAFFLGPNDDTVIEALPACASSQRPPRYEPITAGEMTRRFMARNRSFKATA